MKYVIMILVMLSSGCQYQPCAFKGMAAVMRCACEVDARREGLPEKICNVDSVRAVYDKCTEHTQKAGIAAMHKAAMRGYK